MAWRIEYEGQVYREVDLTLDQAEQIQNITGTDWGQLHPLTSASHAKATLAVCIAARTGAPVGEVLAKVGSTITVDQFVDMVSKEDATADLPATYEDGFPPVADGTSTPS